MISIKKVSKSYGDKLIIDELNLQIISGQVYGLIGRNGAGKTTLMKMICGLTPPDSGEVFCAGKSSVSGESYRRMFGYIPQENALFEKLSVMDNLLYWGGLYGLSKKAIRNRGIQLLSSYKLKDRVNDSIETLSGGMKKIVSIVCAVLHQPKVLICDEPTVGVDPRQRENIYDLLAKLKEEGSTIIYSSHYLEEVEKICDRVGFLYNKKIIMDNTIDEIKTRFKNKEKLVLTVDSNVDDAVFNDDRVSTEKDTITFDAIDVHNELTPFLELVQGRGYKVLKLEVQPPSLESVFLDQVN